MLALLMVSVEPGSVSFSFSLFIWEACLPPAVPARAASPQQPLLPPPSPPLPSLSELLSACSALALTVMFLANVELSHLKIRLAKELKT